MTITRSNAAMSCLSPASYANIFNGISVTRDSTLPRRCNFLHSLFLCTPSWPANFARVETAFPSRFLCTRFNLFYVKYRASAARHDEINFLKLASTWVLSFLPPSLIFFFTREKLCAIETATIPLKMTKWMSNGDIAFYCTYMLIADAWSICWILQATIDRFDKAAPRFYLSSWRIASSQDVTASRWMPGRGIGNRRQFRDMYAPTWGRRWDLSVGFYERVGYTRLSCRDGCSIMSTCSTCQPLRLNRSPDYPMTHNARPALSKPSGRTPDRPSLSTVPLVSLLSSHRPSARQLAAGMQHREAIVALWAIPDT